MSSQGAQIFIQACANGRDCLIPVDRAQQVARQCFVDVLTDRRDLGLKQDIVVDIPHLAFAAVQIVQPLQMLEIIDHCKALSQFFAANVAVIQVGWGRALG